MELGLTGSRDSRVGPCARQGPLMATVSLFEVVICPFVIKPYIKLLLNDFFGTGSGTVLKCAFWKLI